MTNHLWQSTLFAIAAGVLSLALRANRAQVRFWVWFSASLKFLLPFALLMRLGSLAPAPSKPVAPAAFSVVVEQIAMPFSDPLPPASAPAARDWRPAALFGVWACGFLTVVAIRFRSWRTLRAAPLREPGVVGLWRPKLILPAGIEQRLTPAQLEAVVAHELCHVERRDNLLAAMHMLVEAIFWFHPLVWWIGARLLEERELACDEEVLRRGCDPDVYAEAILNVCKLYAESPLACVAGVTGADLKKRIEAIVINRIAAKLSLAKKLTLGVAGIAALAAPILVGILKTPRLRAQSTAKFEVAAIKLCKPGEAGGRGGTVREESPERFNADCQTVEQLIQQAYGTRRAAEGIFGGPAWIHSDRYRIEAKAETPQTKETMMGPLLQTLLEERFQLKVHRESKEVPVYWLAVAKGGLKLQPTPAGECEPQPRKMVAALDAGWPRPKPCGIFFGKTPTAALFTLYTRGLSLAGLARELSVVLDRPVLDKTGVAGNFDLKVEFSPDETTPALTRRQFFTVPEGTPPDPGASVLTALESQAGLKLEPGKGPRDFLVIDRVERPTEN